MWLMGPVALWHVGSSQTRARTRVPALAGRFSTTAPPGKPLLRIFKILKVTSPDSSAFVDEIDVIVFIVKNK